MLTFNSLHNSRELSSGECGPDHSRHRPQVVPLRALADHLPGGLQDLPQGLLAHQAPQMPQVVLPVPVLMPVRPQVPNSKAPHLQMALPPLLKPRTPTNFVG